MPEHNIPPVFDENSKILILGSFPSVKSRESEFFYGHPQNRFWRVLAMVFGCRVPETVEEKNELLLSNGVALWDVIASCNIEGSDDASITNVVPNKVNIILNSAEIKKIYTNGGKADELYRKFLLKKTGIAAVKLPSTSPANARSSLEMLVDKWKIIKG